MLPFTGKPPDHGSVAIFHTLAERSSLTVSWDAGLQQKSVDSISHLHSFPALFPADITSLVRQLVLLTYKPMLAGYKVSYILSQVTEYKI